MDHLCHKCGHNIEQGKAFCAECGAPQIRVAMAEASIEAMPAGDGTRPQAGGDLEGGFAGIPARSLPGRWSHAMRPCGLAAAIAIGLSLVGLNPFVAALGAGFLAVAFWRRRSPGIVIRAGAGASLGALSGLLLFSASVILEMLAVVLLHRGAEMRGEMIDKVQQTAARYPGPQVQPFLDFVKSPDGFAIMMVASLLFGLVAFIALGSVGGALGAAFLGRNDRS